MALALAMENLETTHAEAELDALRRASLDMLPMLPTPSTSHLSFENIYEPAEDSFLLLDTLNDRAEIGFLRAKFGNGQEPTPLAIEVGTGSGVILGFLTAHAQIILGRPDLLTIGTDVNPFACLATRQTVQKAVADESQEPLRWSPSFPYAPAVYLDPLVADIHSPIRPGAVDILIFNPPYVPTAELPAVVDIDPREGPLPSGGAFERDSHLLSLSYAGGVDGMETTDRLLADLPELLSSRGVAYLVLCQQNRPQAVKERIKCWGEEWQAEIVRRSGKTAAWENLHILRIWRGTRPPLPAQGSYSSEITE